jgi:hypothetical protein
LPVTDFCGVVVVDSDLEELPCEQAARSAPQSITAAVAVAARRSGDRRTVIISSEFLGMHANLTSADAGSTHD